MSERKVLNKYYPPDYDPSKIPRLKKKNKQNDVRMMAPINMRCSTCGNYIASATKFNAKKEISDEKYNGIAIIRFYIKCPRCMGTIIFRTNPKEACYEVEHGATENFMALKLADKQAREEAEAEEEEEKINPMKHLENRTKASRKQMEASDHLQSLRTIKHQYHKISIDDLIEKNQQDRNEGPGVQAKRDDDDDIRKQAMELLQRRAICSSQSTSCEPSEPKPKLVNPAAPKSKNTSALAGLKKKIKITPKAKACDGNTDVCSTKRPGAEKSSC